MKPRPSRARAAIAAAALLAGLVGVATGAGTASAGHADQNCDSTEWCLWENANKAGCLLGKDSSDADFTNNNPCHWSGNDFNDDASSGRNRKSSTVSVCGSINYGGGPSATMVAGGSYDQLPNNDTASSAFVGVNDCI